MKPFKIITVEMHHYYINYINYASGESSYFYQITSNPNIPYLLLPRLCYKDSINLKLCLLFTLSHHSIFNSSHTDFWGIIEKL